MIDKRIKNKTIFFLKYLLIYFILLIISVAIIYFVDVFIIKNLDYNQLSRQLISLIKTPILSNPKSNILFEKNSQEVKNFEVISIYRKFKT